MMSDIIKKRYHEFLLSQPKKNLFTNAFHKYALLILILVFYLISGAILLNYYKYQLNSDGVAYLSIAKNYAALNLDDAINGFWGPLISWLMTPIIILGVPPILGAKLLLLFIGLCLIVGFWFLVEKFHVKKSIQVILSLALVPLTIFFALSQITPDLPLLCVLVFYFNFIFDLDYSKKISNGIFCGSLGALSYLCKPYALYFFIIHFILFNILQYMRNVPSHDKKNIIKNMSVGILVFLVLSGMWIAVISNRYDAITLSNSGIFNFELMGPDNTYVASHGVFSQGLVNPPGNHANSIRDDLSYYKLAGWNPLGSTSNFIYLLKIVYNNIIVLFDTIETFSIFSIFIIIIYTCSLFALYRKKILENNYLYPVVTIIIYTIGFIPFHLENRYLWVDCLLLLLIYGVLVDVIFKYGIFKFILSKFNLNKNIVMKFVIIVLSLTFIISPINEVSYQITTGYRTDKMILDTSEVLSSYGVSGNLASNGHNSYYMSFYLNSRYFGTSAGNNNSTKLNKDLHDYGINYYLFWNNSSDNNVDFSKISYKKVIKDNRSPNLTVYLL